MTFPYRAISFDCFGTLIDWHTGQTRVLEQFPSLRKKEDRIAELIELRGVLEIELQNEDFRTYTQILEQSLEQACTQLLGVELTPSEKRAFATSQLGWPAFEDTVTSLAQLKELAPLALLSNCDAQTLRLSAHKHLRTPIDLFVSSEEIRSYKPALNHWGAALAAFGIQAHELLHVSFSSFHDLLPAASLGVSLGFVGRYKTPAPEDIELAVQGKSLSELAKRLRALS